MSEEERDGAIRGGSDPDWTFVVPNGVDVRRFVPGEKGELAPAAFPEVFYVAPSATCRTFSDFRGYAGR
jgi:hypothetical protein